MLASKNNPLVPGATYDLKVGLIARLPQQIRLIRAICLDGKRVEAGEIVKVAPAMASELISSGKAVREAVPPPVPKQPDPPVAPAVATAPTAQRKADKPPTPPATPTAPPPEPAAP